MKRIITFILLLSCISTGMAQEFKAMTGKVSGSYNFWFFDPEVTHAPGAHYPLLIFLHGQSLCGKNLQKVKRYGAVDVVAKGKNVDTYIIAPQNPGGAWNPQKIMSLIEWAEKNYYVDSSRIYVYGMSLGGYGTIDMLATYPDRIACGMALCGGASVKDLSGLSKVPLWIMHGTADRAVPVAQSDKVVEAIKATGDSSRLIYSRMKGVNHGGLARVFYMTEAYDWMFSHSLDDPGREVNRMIEIDASMLKDAYNEMRNKNPEDIEY